MSTYYKLRVTLLDDIRLDKLLACIRAACPCFAYALEGGGDTDVSPHLHFYLDLQIPPKTLKSQLRALGAVGNRCLSLKILDEQYPLQYLAYLQKGGRFHQKGIPDSVMADVLAYDEKVKKEMKQKKEKKKTQFQCIKEFVAEQVASLSREDTIQSRRMFQNTVERAVLQYHVDKEILIRRFQIVAYVDTIMMSYYSNDDWYMHNWLSDVFRRELK